MRASSFVALSAAALASAAPSISNPQTAIVVVETAHGGVHNDRTNRTITVPFDIVYFNHDALAAVSTLYLLGPDNAICTPYKDENGTVNGGRPFSVGYPSLLSTNSVVVGSLVCTLQTPI